MFIIESAEEKLFVALDRGGAGWYWVKEWGNAKIWLTEKEASHFIGCFPTIKFNLFQVSLRKNKWVAGQFGHCPEKKKCVHTEHCCAFHGCKYGEDGCPVVRKTKEQSHPCEYCNEPD